MSHQKENAIQIDEIPGSSIETELREHGFVISPAKGFSMTPLLRPEKCLVKIVQLQSRPKKYDVVLFRAPGGKIVLHRILEVHPEDFVLCGDANLKKEGLVRDAQIMGILDSFVRDTEKKPLHWVKTTDLWYRGYSRLIVAAGEIRRRRHRRKRRR